MGSNPSTVKTPNVQATGLMANPSSSHPPQSASPIPFQQAPYYPGQQPGQIQWQMPYPPQYVPAAPQPVQNPVQPVPQQNSRQKSGQPQAGEPHIVHHHVYPQVIQNPGMQQGPVTYQVTPTQPFPIWPTNYTYVPQPAPAQVPPPPQFQETTKPVPTTNATQQPPQQQQQTTENSVPLLKMAQNNTTNNTTQPTEGAQQQPQQQQTSGQTQPNAFVQLSQQKFAQPIDYSLPAPPKSFCPQYRAQPKVPVAPVVQFPAMNVAMPYGYGAVQPVYGQPVDYLGNFIQPPNPYGTCNQAFQTANNNGYSYQPIAQY